MKERLISYTNAMILAKLAGRKTQTRRLLKEQINWVEPPTQNGAGNWCGFGSEDPLYMRVVQCPFGKVGDILLAREGYKIRDCRSYRSVVFGSYLADGQTFAIKLTGEEFAKWEARKFPYRATPGRFMYKSLARLRDVITDIRVQKIQDISEEDAKAEGVDGGCLNCGMPSLDGCGCDDPAPDYRDSFIYLWNFINEPLSHPWENNDWVFAIITKPEGS